jgi:hypothetical protein
MILFLPAEVFAKGGSLKGLGSLVEGSGLVISDTIFYIIILGVIIAFDIAAFVVWNYYKKNKDAKDLAGKIEKYDGAWNIRELEKHVINTFYKIYEARTERNQGIARNYITPSLYNTYKSQTDALLARNHRHVFKRVHLDKIKIMGINDYKDDTKDSFWAYIKGSAFDYYTDSFSKIISGNSSKPSHFREMWKFIRTPQGWVLERRDPYVVWSFLEAKSFTEGYDEDLSNGYMFCGNCEGYYALEDGESPEDFDVCRCGGSLRYYDDFEGLFKENKKI